MTLNIKNYIDVQTIIAGVPQARRDFRIPLFVFKGVEVGGSRVQFYSSLADVVDAYGSNSEPAKAVASFYQGGFNGLKPSNVMVANFDQVGGELWADVIVELLSDARYYGIATDQTFTEAENLALASSVEANSISYMFMKQSDDTEIKDTDVAVDTGSIAKVCYDNKYKRTMIIYRATSQLNEYADMKFLSYFAVVDFTSSRPLGNLAYKQYAGLTATDLTNGEAQNLLSKNSAYYSALGEVGRNVAYKGVMASGDWADVILAVDYINYNMTYDIFDLMIRLPRLAYTLSDFSKLEQAMSKVFIRMREAGVIAGGVDPDTGEELPLGYKIDIPSPSQIDPVDKAMGILKGITNIGLLSGGAVKFTITNILKYSA